MSLRDEIVPKVIAAGANLTVRSALNPALWLCAIVSVPCAVLASVLQQQPPFWLTLMATGPVLVTVIGFLFLLLFDRDKLQSESYQLRKQTLELIEQKGDLHAVDASTIELISNVDRPALQGSEADSSS